MTDEIETIETETEAPSVDIDAAVDSIAKGLNFSEEESSLDSNESDADINYDDENKDSASEPGVKETTSVRQAPASWAKEKHEIWNKLSPDAQDQVVAREEQMLRGLQQYQGDAGFGQKMREVMNPYKGFIESQGVDEPKAVQYLLNAHYKLTHGGPAEKAEYLSYLAKSYGINLTPDENQPQIDPVIKSLQEEVNQLKSGLTRRQETESQEVRQRVANDVETFATDPKHPYFDEVAEDMLPLLRSGAPIQDAYDKAVWGNPVTRAKEMSRIQTENEKKLRENSRLDALKAKKAASSNVNGRDTRRAPTEPSGKLFSAEYDAEMREIIRKQSH